MATFNYIINSSKPVLVDFNAALCGLCKMQAPILKEHAAYITGKARILKVDIDKSPVAATRYGVRSVPTLIIFKNGEIKWMQSGVMPKHQLLNILSPYF